jgi:hypothetical protein
MAAKRSRMESESTTRWPLLNERLPAAPPATRVARRRPPRSVWLLTGLAFLCGGLVSAAGFSIGWRHQAQRNTAAEAALSTATARTHTLEQRVGVLQASLIRQRLAAAAAAASERSLVTAAGRLHDKATASSGSADAVSSGAGTIAASAARIASELKTLDTYLTTTPAGDLDPGYIASQTTYLARQLAGLQAGGAGLNGSITSFEAATRSLARSAAALSSR